MRRVASTFFGIQGAAVFGWWALLVWVPGSRSLFFPSGALDATLRALVLPDLLVLGFGSLAAATAIGRELESARALAWLVSGASLYATLFTLLWSVLSGAPALSALLMVASSIGSVYCALRAV